MMKKLFLLFTMFLILTAFRAKEDFFKGKILYKYSFTDLQGNDINDKLAPYMGREQHYFIDGSSYKSYNQDRLSQLYNSETNAYYFFKDRSAVQKFDASKATSGTFNVKHLDMREKVAGYDCKAIQVETDDAVTVYYYSPKVKTDKKVFVKHNFGEWNKYLEATDGALALKYVMTNKQYGYVMTSTAAEVTRMDFAADDFVLPKDVVVKE